MNDDLISFIPDNSYIIPGRLVKQLIQTLHSSEHQRTPLDRFIEALDSMGVLYQSESCCGTPEIHQVWFNLPGGRELVCEFDNTTEMFTGFYLEE